jgi:hypothetical protein
MKCRTIIEIEEGTGGSPQFDTSYVDEDGNQHYRVKLAEITRNSPTIDQSANITDQRISITSMTHDLEDHPSTSQNQANAFYAMISPTTANHIICKEDLKKWTGNYPHSGISVDIGLNTIFTSTNSPGDEYACFINPGTVVALFDTDSNRSAIYGTADFARYTTTYLAVIETELAVRASMAVGGDTPGANPGPNGVDENSLTGSSWYYLYLIVDLSGPTVAGVLSRNSDKPDIGGGAAVASLQPYTLYRKISAARWETNPNATKLRFLFARQRENMYHYLEVDDYDLVDALPGGLYHGDQLKLYDSTFADYTSWTEISINTRVPPNHGNWVLVNIHRGTVSGNDPFNLLILANGIRCTNEQNFDKPGQIQGMTQDYRDTIEFWTVPYYSGGNKIRLSQKKVDTYEVAHAVSVRGFQFML